MADSGNPINKVPFLGSLFGSQPSVNTVDINPNASALIDQDVHRAATQTDQDVYDKTMQNVNGNYFDQSDKDLQGQADKTGTDPSMLKAIRNQYSQKTNQAIQSMKSQQQVQSQIDRGQQMSDFAKTALAKQQVATNNFAQLSSAYQASEQARGQFISSLINIGSTANSMNNQNNSQRGRPGQMNQQSGPDFNSGSINDNPYAGAMNDSGYMNA